MPKSFLITNKRYNNISSSSSSVGELRDEEPFQTIDLHHHQQQQQQPVDEGDEDLEMVKDESRIRCSQHRLDEDNDNIPSPTASVSSSSSCNNFESDILDVCSLDNVPKPFDLRCPPLPRGVATFSSPMSPPGGDTTPTVCSPPSDALSRLYASVMVDGTRTSSTAAAAAAAAAARFTFFPDPRLAAGIPPFQPSLYPFAQQHPEVSRPLPVPPQHPEDRVLMPLVHKLLLQHRHQLQQVVATAAIHQRDRSSTFSPCAGSFDSDSADSGVVAMAADRSPSGPVGAAVDSAAAAASATYHCVECGRAYSTASNLARHRQSHRIGTTGSGFGSASSSSSSSSSCSQPAVDDRRGGTVLLEVGGSSSQTSSSRKCPHCDKTYSSAPAYSMHVRTHSQGCACPQCGKRFSRPWLLQGHIRTHTGEKPFRCPHCGKTFADKSNLRAHIQTHSPDKPHVCGRCGKAFALRSYLYKHEESSCMRSHRLYHGYPYLRPPPPSSSVAQQQQQRQL